MYGNDPQDERPRPDHREAIRPTVWGYATVSLARPLQGDVPGVARRLVRRSDVLVRGLTPRELRRVQRHAERQASVDGIRLALVTGAVAAVATFAVGHALPAETLALCVVAAAVSSGALAGLLARVGGPVLSRVERRALRDAVEIHRLRVAPPTSAGMRVLVAMRAVENVEKHLDEQQQAVARELLWSALDAVRTGDAPALEDATAAMLRLAVRATTSRLGARDEYSR